ncbi:MAG: serine aminopeptidase domain-containing protein, partial [Planctomycetota bacterium]
MRRLIWLLCIFGAAMWGGCNGYSTGVDYTTTDQMDNGLVIILPGIEGESPMNHDIRRGLSLGGVPCALPIYNWGRPIPGVGMLLNQMDFVGNRIAGTRIAKMIEQYQDEHPGKPVYLVGHSGGGGIAVFTAEAMPEDRQVDGLVLLSASIWAGYDLTKALGRCRSGIVNFYNESDVGLLGIGTTITSNVDGMRGPSAGLIGFDKPKDSDPPTKKLPYNKLFQVRMTVGMTGGDDPHAAATRPGFVSAHVAPWVNSRIWPVGSFLPAAQKFPVPQELTKA